MVDRAGIIEAKGPGRADQDTGKDALTHPDHFCFLLLFVAPFAFAMLIPGPACLTASRSSRIVPFEGKGLSKFQFLII